LIVGGPKASADGLSLGLFLSARWAVLASPATKSQENCGFAGAVYLVWLADYEMARLDPLTRTERSERMSRVRNRDTKPEIRIRSALFGLGYRFRLHAKGLPGRPDIVFPGRKKVVLVHGCFWHLHEPCRQYRMPRTRVRFWTEKLLKNRLRDKVVAKELKAAGWKALTVWECELKNFDALIKRIARFLEE
jgi:DNA mismatch endonuclease, patch repair protein